MTNLDKVRIVKMSFIRRHRTFFAGLFLVIPVIIIPILLGYALMKVEFMQGWCNLHVIGDNTYGLSKGSPVTISGMVIGHVAEVKLLHEGAVETNFKIQRSYQPLVKKDTRARFQQKSPVVGEWIIELTGGTETAEMVSEEDTLEAVLPFRFDKTVQQVTSVISHIESIVAAMAGGSGTAGQLLVKDTLAGLAYRIGRNIDGLISAVETTLANADSMLAEFTKLGHSGNGVIDSFSFVAGEVRTSLSNVTAILGNLHEASGDVEPMLKEVRDEIGEADRMMRSLQRSWIYRKLEGKRDDPLLNESP